MGKKYISNIIQILGSSEELFACKTFAFTYKTCTFPRQNTKAMKYNFSFHFIYFFPIIMSL